MISQQSTKNINRDSRFRGNVMILPFILISLLLGIWTGWIRLGWSFPLISYAGNHGAMMTGGFIGTLICLERSFGFKNKLALIIPALSSLSILFFILDIAKIAYLMLLFGSIGLVILYFILYSKFNELHVLLMLIGALCWLTGNAILLKTYFYPSAVMWWIAFVFYTIVAERIELSRYLNISKFKNYLLTGLMLIYIIGILIPFHNSGGYIVGFSLIASAIWLFKYDMARLTVRLISKENRKNLSVGKVKISLKKGGQHFFSGLVLLFGYGWLIICGLFMAYGSYSGLLYDPAVHFFFLGFVFSMIFAHAPIILPGVLKLQTNPFNKSLYLWFVLLQLSLISRILSSLTGIVALKHSGGLFNGIAILGFFVTMIILVISNKKTVASS